MHRVCSCACVIACVPAFSPTLPNSATQPPPLALPPLPSPPLPLPSPPLPPSLSLQTVLFSQNDQARMENALIEAALASSVNHANVVSLYHYDMKPVSVDSAQSGEPGARRGMQVLEDSEPRDWKMYLVRSVCVCV
jgi:hypothetical protein